MVEKIDKPEPPPPYYIQSTTETRRDHSGGGGQPTSDEYSGSHAAPGWQKLYAESSNRRYLKLRRDDISRAWFRNTIMQRGVFLAEVDIQTKNNQLFKNAHIILTRESFWSLKQFQAGQEIPLNMIVREPVIEISIPMPRPAAQPGVRETKPGEATGKKLNVKNIAIYAAIGIVLLLMIIFIMNK